ncbi:MAG: hypothetical protein EXR71_10940 [Myxococcales bacterium]|nr:hypothetical protein [Myxococcales bacterium]
MWVLWLASCADSEAERLRAALAAPDLASASAACERLADPGRDSCLVSALERFDGLAPASCDAVRAPLWQGECRFQYAERLALQGEAAAAFVACQGTPFHRECGYHLLRGVARGVLDASPAEAADALAPWRRVPGLDDAPRLFWKAWFRERRRADQGLDPTGCPEASCEQAARESYLESLRAVHHADPADFCASPPVPVRGWAATETTAAWQARWVADTCARAVTPPQEAIAPPP